MYMHAFIALRGISALCILPYSLQNGDTPLLMAVHNGHLAVVKMLIEKYQRSANEMFQVNFGCFNIVIFQAILYVQLCMDKHVTLLSAFSKTISIKLSVCILCTCRMVSVQFLSLQSKNMWTF